MINLVNYINGIIRKISKVFPLRCHFALCDVFSGVEKENFLGKAWNY
jgi:hypothetical protein